MRVTLNWLREFVEFDWSPEELAERLDMSGTKVESIRRPSEGLSGVVVAEVLDVADHPRADKLTLVEVRAGDNRTHRVVCGARNFSVGDRVPLAMVGARLPGGVEITQRRIRGEASEGMLCSGAELGVSRDHSGILVLPPDAPVGQDVVETLGLDDTILELEITLNRPDCMSVVGVAREIAALAGSRLRLPEPDLGGDPALDMPGRVEIDDPVACPRYLLRYVADLKVAPSPHWMSTRLTACGLRPVSNVVDVTNYVMLELGHPLHAFDARRVEQATIVVRRARPGERLVTLDGTERELDPADLLICDPVKPLGLAGVMGGLDSEVSEDTDAVLLEAAYFDPPTIAATSRRHLLRTEASARFERGADPEAPPLAAARVLELLREVAGGRAAAGQVDVYPTPIERERIRLRPQRTGRVLGVDIDPAEQRRWLEALGLEVEESDGVLEVRVPTFRPDLKREIDLIEEVGRLHGFEDLPSTLPPGRDGGLDRAQRFDRSLRRILAGLGLHEAWTGSLSSPSDLDRLGLPQGHPARRLVRIENPMSEEESALRSTLLPGLLRAVALNQAHRIADVALFEVARVYEPADDRLPHERPVVGAVMSGRRVGAGWRERERPWDFFAAKGVVEAALDALGLPPADFEPLAAMPFHPTRAARLGLHGEPLGVLGELHPDVCARFEVAEGTVAFELGVEVLLSALPRELRAASPPRLPPTLIDLAVVVPEDVPAGRVAAVIAEAGRPELAGLRLFDLYRGEQVGPGRKSLAFSLELRRADSTITDEEAIAIRDRIVAALAERTGGTLRT